MNEDLLVPKKERKKLIRLFKEFLPTTGLTYEEYVVSDQLTKKAIEEAFRAWLRKRTSGK